MLSFIGAVPLGDFAVTIVGVATPVQRIKRDGQTITLLLSDNALHAGDKVRITWDGGSLQLLTE